jgi:hypothetical protein
MHATQLEVTADTMTPAATLRSAADYLIRHGWWQGDLYDDPDQPTPAACALGAIRMAVYGTASIERDTLTVDRAVAYDRAARQLAGHLANHGEIGGVALAAVLPSVDVTEVVGNWNDQPDRNAAQVLAVLVGAADEWDRVHATPAPPAATGGEHA